jgi:hypothetical protein
MRGRPAPGEYGGVSPMPYGGADDSVVHRAAHSAVLSARALDPLGEVNSMKKISVRKTGSIKLTSSAQVYTFVGC